MCGVNYQVVRVMPDGSQCIIHARVEDVDLAFKLLDERQAENPKFGYQVLRVTTEIVERS